MKRKFEILDCTLRDGGYYTNWDFDKSFVVNYLQTMEATEAIDIIEVGYRSTPKKEYMGEYFYCPKYFLTEAKKIAPSKKIAIMLNVKDVSLKDIYIVDDCIGSVDIIRLASSPSQLKHAVLLASKIKEKGFKVALNLMYLSDWLKDEPFLDGLKSIKDKVDYLYLVDSFGSVQPDKLPVLIAKVQKFVSVPIGFHAHNNLELALINSLEAIRAGCSVVDVTISGMGRGAGNLSSELLLTYLSSRDEIEFNLTRFSGIVSEVGKLKKQYEWGASFPYIISGAYSLAQSNVMSWLSKERHDVDSVVNALQNQKDRVMDSVKLKTFSSPVFEKVLIIGGGESVSRYFHGIRHYLEGEKDIALIHAGCKNLEFFAGFNHKNFVCLSGSEANRFDLLNIDHGSVNLEVIIGPYPREMGVFLPKKQCSKIRELKNYTFTDKYDDSLFAIALQLAIDVRALEINLVGFDGYDLDSSLLSVMKENQYLIDSFNLKSDFKINSFTPTRYDNISTNSIFCCL